MSRSVGGDGGVDVVAGVSASSEEKEELPEDVDEVCGGRGLFALADGGEHGGVEVSMHGWVQVIERIARESPAVALMILISAIGSDALVFSGSAEQQRAILPALAAGEAKICFALTEPNAGPDISAISTTALPDGDGYTLNGGKIFIPNGPVGHWFTVFARVVEDGQSKPSCFIVHRDTPGLVIGRKEDKMGLRGSVTSQPSFEHMHVGPEAGVGEVGDGFAIAHHTLNRGRLAVAGLATGVTAASLAAAAAYAKERIQFGKHIADLPAIRLMLADMEITLEASRLLLDQAASAFGGDIQTMMKTASVAKVYCSEAAVKAAETAVQIFGGYGLCTDYPVERYYSDDKSFTLVEAPRHVQRSLIAKSVLKEY